MKIFAPRWWFGHHGALNFTQTNQQQTQNKK